MLAMVENGQLQPEKLIGKKVALVEAAPILMEMDTFQQTGITVIDQF
jgi:alcohol dehydrogenase